MHMSRGVAALGILLLLGTLPGIAAGQDLQGTAAPAKKVVNSPEKQATGSCCEATSLPVAAWNVLREDIRSDRKSDRSAAVTALGAVGARPDILPLLQAALKDKDASVRKDAALTLGNLGSRSAEPQLRKLLDDPSPEVGFAAASALAKMGDHSGRGIFVATLQGERKGDGFVKSSFKSNVERYRDPKQLAFVAARQAAGSLFGPLSIGVIVAQQLMTDRGAAARGVAATLLAEDPSNEAVNELKLALLDKNWAVRAAAAQALVKSPGKVPAETFEPLLVDDHEEVRAIAAAGIIRISHAPRPDDLRWPLPSAHAALEAGQHK